MSGPGSPSVRKKASKSPLRPLMPAPAPAKPVPPLPPRYGAGEAHASAHCRLRRAYAGVSLRQAYGSCWHRLAGDADEALEIVDQQRRDRTVEPVRAHEAAQELLPPALVVRLAGEQVAQLAEVLLERAGDDQRAAVLGEQVLEVEGLLLSALQLGEQDRVGPLADDRRVDQRRRVRADHRGRVVDRVVEARAPRLVRGVLTDARPHGDVRERAQGVLGPDRAVRRMRPDEDADAGELGVDTQRLDPGGDDRTLVGSNEPG